MAFRNYLEGEDDAPYYKLNSLAHYYEEMERYAALIKEMTGYIKDYGNELGLTKEEIDQRVTAYILENKTQLDQRLGEWDEKLQQFDGSVTDLLAEWVDDGTLNHIIDTTLIDEKVDPLTALLAETAKKTEVRQDTARNPINISEMDTETKQLFTGGSVAVVGENSVGVENLKKKAVQFSATNFLEVASNNRFNPYDSVNGFKVSTTGVITPDSAFTLSGPVKVQPGETWYQSRPSYVRVTDINDNFVAVIPFDYEFTIPENGAWIRTYFDAGKESTALICKAINKTFDKFKVKSEILPELPSNLNSLEGLLHREKTDFITVTGSSNLFNKNDVEKGYVYNTDGSRGFYAGYSSSGLIEVIPGKTYRKNTRGTYTYWDKNALIVSGVVSAPGIETFTVPNNPVIKHMRFAIQDAAIDSEMMVEGTTLPSTYVPFVKKEYFLSNEIKVPMTQQEDKMKGLKWAVLGDSLSTTDYASKPYHSWIAERTGILPTKYAVTGSSFTIQPGKADSISERWNNMISDADIITIWGGRNDFTWKLPIGTKNDRTNATLYGACHVVFGGIVNKYLGRKVGVILTPQRPVDPASNYNDTDLVFEYLKAIQEVAEYYSIPVLDLYRQGGLASKVNSVYSAYFTDNVHPNNAGHEILSRRVEEWLRTL